MDPQQVHQLAGAIILLLSGLLLAKQVGVVRGVWPQFVLPAGITLMGMFLFFDPIVFHGGSFGMEGIQHQVQGAPLMVAGVVELARALGKLQNRAYAMVLPVVFFFLGMVFLLHSQEVSAPGMAAQIAEHRILALTIILVAVIKGVDSLELAKGNWARVGWLLLLIVVSIELLMYAPAGVA